MKGNKVWNRRLITIIREKEREREREDCTFSPQTIEFISIPFFSDRETDAEGDWILHEQNKKNSKFVEFSIIFAFCVLCANDNLQGRQRDEKRYSGKERAKGSSHSKQLIKMYSRGSATDDAISSDTTHLGSESRTKWERQTEFRALKRKETFITTSKCSVFPWFLFFSSLVLFSSSPLHSNYFSFSFKLLFRCQILYSFCRIKVSEFEIRSILLMLSFSLTFKAAFFSVSPFDCCSCSSSSLSLFFPRCTFLSFPHMQCLYYISPSLQHHIWYHSREKNEQIEREEEGKNKERNESEKQQMTSDMTSTWNARSLSSLSFSLSFILSSILF